MKIELKLNGAAVTWDVAPGASLLDALRDASCLSVKRGCETGDCGACTVLLDDQPVNACVVPAPRARGRAVSPLEGLLDAPLLIRLRDAFVASGAVQCGYCSPGMLISMYALIRDGKRLDEHSIREALGGNLCRCTGYVKPIAACRAVLADWEVRS